VRPITLARWARWASSHGLSQHNVSRSGIENEHRGMLWVRWRTNSIRQPPAIARAVLVPFPLAVEKAWGVCAGHRHMI
jgi:hypothetical protein